MLQLRANLVLVLTTLLLCCVLYPLVLLAVGQVAFSDSANGSLIERDGKAVGSPLIAQNFSADRYFWPRPSAANYNAAASGASNYAASNPRLRFRVARQLGPIVKYVDGRPVGPDVEKWFAEKDRLAAWAAENPTLAAEWVKTDDSTKKAVIEYTKANPDVLERWRKDNADGDLPNVDENPEAVAVQFFASFAAKNPRKFPAGAADLQGVFFDAWLQEHRDAKLQPVPADMVTASGSGLDPHISLANARYQLDRVVAARSPTEADRTNVRRRIESIVESVAFRPLGGLTGGDRLVNVVEVNLRLDHELPVRPAR
ncbi:MAG TPA: potassium-transporting ATPase subunit C [Gemmataceae bacterium]|nr:potassium-transporting ATPase subunit C [Gemmataceae bacterium]